MRRFTVSLPDDLYATLLRRGEESAPPATLQQLVRYAVDTMVQQRISDEAEPETTAGDDSPSATTATDLLVFAVGEVTYGLPIELVETVAAGLEIHPVPTTSNSLLGVAGFRGTLTEVHDGGVLLQSRPLDSASSLLAIPGSTARVLLTVSSVAGLTPHDELEWASPPNSAPPWVAGLAWTDGTVITVVSPAALNL